LEKGIHKAKEGHFSSRREFLRKGRGIFSEEISERGKGHFSKKREFLRCLFLKEEISSAAEGIVPRRGNS
jgi:hypothetical protein